MCVARCTGKRALRACDRIPLASATVATQAPNRFGWCGTLVHTLGVLSTQPLAWGLHGSAWALSPAPGPQASPRTGGPPTLPCSGPIMFPCCSGLTTFGPELLGPVSIKIVKHH